ncbi:META domain-containing protein [Variovorax sp. KK3]|uniref:META domain-containing protein n=1 Tax=Variovorax sp. KK3 TaxID=1855728 RepID=UPI00097C17F0|nr:META domain-containing protein [Variovorax sp. KK3]
MRFLFLTTALAASMMVSGCGSGINLDEPIEGPVWQLEQLGNELIEPSADPRRNAKIQFDRSSGRITGSGGCNNVSGTYERSGSTLRMRQLGATRMACPNEAANINETQFFAALQATTSYRLQGNAKLSLLDGNGRTVATLSNGGGR